MSPLGLLAYLAPRGRWWEYPGKETEVERSFVTRSALVKPSTPREKTQRGPNN